jgi:hypothetical protein
MVPFAIDATRMRAPQTSVASPQESLVSMSQHKATTMFTSIFSKTGNAFLLISLSTACSAGSASSSDGGNPAASGNTSGGGDPAAGGTPSGGGSPAVGESPADGGSPAVGEGLADGGSPADGESRADGGIPSDGGNSTLSVNLGASANYAILAKSGISAVPTSAITGNLGISPAAATYITGFALTADPTNVFAIASQVTGKVYAADYATPTPSDLTAAIGDMQLAFTDAAGRAPGVTELGAGNIGGKTIGPGVYKWSTGLQIPTDVTLSGKATDVWIFQVAQDVTMSSATKVVLSGGALPRNIYWQVAGLVDLGTTAHCEGVVLSKTSIALKTGASINGRLLAQTAVTLDSSTVVAPVQ